MGNWIFTVNRFFRCCFFYGIILSTFCASFSLKIGGNFCPQTSTKFQYHFEFRAMKRSRNWRKNSYFSTISTFLKPVWFPKYLMSPQNNEKIILIFLSPQKRHKNWLNKFVEKVWKAIMKINRINMIFSTQKSSKKCGELREFHEGIKSALWFLAMEIAAFISHLSSSPLYAVPPFNF